MFWTLELSKEEGKETISDFEKYLLIFVSNNLYFSILRRLKKKKKKSSVLTLSLDIRVN